MNKHFIKFGLFAGISSIIITLVLYLIDPKIMLQAGSWLIIIVTIVFMVRATKDKKKELGGFITFKEAFSESWLTYLVYAIVSTIFTYALFNFIDPGLKDTVNEISIEAIEKMSGLLGEEGVAKAVEEIEKGDNFTISKMLANLAGSLVMGALVGLIIAAVLKSPKPANWEDDEWKNNTTV